MNSLREVAHAKLNLGLKVIGRREDGFHDLVSLFQTIDLADELTLTPSAKLSLRSEHESMPMGPDNLAWKAADLYLQEMGGQPVDIELVKRIPMGAGLGGGSADAAAVLRGLHRLASRPASSGQLLELAAQLGSDVPFALFGGTMLVEGRGERLTPVAWDPEGLELHYLLVDPGVHVNTAWAYAELDKGISRQNSGLSSSDPYLTFLNSARGGRVPVRRLLEVMDNDFQPVVERAKPIVARASQVLAALTPEACSMTGSGSVVFGIYVDRIAARHAAEQLRRQGYPVFHCTPVPEPVSGCENCGE